MVTKNCLVSRVKTLARSLTIFAFLPEGILQCFLVRTRLLPAHPLPALALKTGWSRLGNSSMRKTNCLATSALRGYRGRAMIASVSCWLRMFPIASLLRWLPFQALSNPKVGWSWALHTLARSPTEGVIATDQVYPVSIVYTRDLVNCTLGSHRPQDLANNEKSARIGSGLHGTANPHLYIDCLLVRFSPKNFPFANGMKSLQCSTNVLFRHISYFISWLTHHQHSREPKGHNSVGGELSLFIIPLLWCHFLHYMYCGC